jgi:predicted acylesterase/phospholipase RssA
MAAFVGAGAKPDFIIDKIANKNLMDLLGPPKSMDLPERTLLRLGGRLMRPFWKRAAHAVLYAGSFSSENLQQWVDDVLAELLPERSRPIKFRDLPIPTWIVATDLAACGAKVWSSTESPSDEVAFAVRASCSIPGFFQPVQHGNNRLVDGGVLANLPSFVYARPGNGQPAYGDRVLAFQLKEDYKPPQAWSVDEILGRTVSAVVDGAIELQAGLQPDVHRVTIETGTIRATDFDKMNPKSIATLLDAGRNAVQEFFGREASEVRAHLDDWQACWSLDELYHAIVEDSELPVARVVVAMQSTDWFWRLFPSVLAWRFHGIPVDVLVPPGQVEPKEAQRRRFISGLGAGLFQTGHLPFRGVVLQRANDRQSSAFVLRSDRSQFEPLATRYFGVKHQEVVLAIRNALDGLIPKQRPPQAPPPELVPFSKDEVRARIATVAQYSQPDVKIVFENIDPAAVMPINKVIRAYKYRQIKRLASLYDQSKIPLFSCIGVRMTDGTVSPITPPVVEVRGDQRIVLEGNTRLYHCWRAGLPSFTGAVVYGVTAALPGRPTPIERVRVMAAEVPPSTAIEQHDENHFRWIERAMRPLA